MKKSYKYSFQYKMLLSQKGYIFFDHPILYYLWGNQKWWPIKVF